MVQARGGHRATVWSWLDLLPWDVTRSDPHLCAIAGYLLTYDGEFDAAKVWLSRIPDRIPHRRPRRCRTGSRPPNRSATWCSRTRSTVSARRCDPPGGRSSWNPRGPRGTAPWRWRSASTCTSQGSVPRPVTISSAPGSRQRPPPGPGRSCSRSPTCRSSSTTSATPWRRTRSPWRRGGCSTCTTSSTTRCSRRCSSCRRRPSDVGVTGNGPNTTWPRPPVWAPCTAGRWCRRSRRCSRRSSGSPGGTWPPARRTSAKHTPA